LLIEIAGGQRDYHFNDMVEAGMLIAYITLYDSVIALYGIQVGAYLWQKPLNATQGQLLGCWTRKIPFEIQLLTGRWDLKLLIRLKIMK